MADRTEKIIRKMGRYSLIDKLGQGSMGVVYKAYDELLDRHVALKTMVSDMTTDTELRKRFYQEARLAAKLNHPYIITVYDLGEADGQLYIAMELLEGRDLKSYLKEGTPLSMEQKLEWMIQLADAFAFAHQEGIIHRDIKPGNIHIRSNGDLVVMDFGIARAASSDITRAGAIIGTPEYISPEQILAIKIDHRVDIFSLGLVFYEILTRTHPFRSVNLPATIHKVLNEKPVPPDQLDPQIPKRLSDLVIKAMEKDAANRFQDCKQILSELQECREELNRQARVLLNSRDIFNHETITFIGRLQDLYSRREFLQICAELGYDPSSGALSDPPVSQEPTYTEASDAYAKAHHRLTRARQYIESSAQIESIMQAGKEFYVAAKFKECIDQMKMILSYYPGHELANEYIQQCNLRLKEQQEAEERRLYVVQTEQSIMNLFQSGDTTNCQREALTLLGIDPNNSIAMNYLRRCEDRITKDQEEELKKKQLTSYLDRAKDLIQGNHHEEALELLKQCEQLDARNPEVKSLISRCQNAIKAGEKRRKQHQEAIEMVNKAISLRTRGEPGKALSLLLDVRKINPDLPELEREIQITEQEIRATDDYRQKLTGQKTLPSWIYPSAILFAAAIIILFWWLLQPNKPFTEDESKRILAAAKQQMESGQLETSLKTLQDYTAKDPTNQEAQQLLTSVKQKITNRLKVEQQAQMAALFDQSRKQEESRDYSGLITTYEAILKLDPLNADAQNGITRARLALADETTRQKLQEEIKASFAEAQNEFARNDFSAARLLVEKILQLDPTHQGARNLLSRVEKKIAEDHASDSRRQKALDLLASAREEIQKKNYDRARTLLNQAADLDPSNTEIGNLQKQIQSEATAPKFGSITINSQPFGTAYIDGQKIGETPIPLRKIPAGQHVITIKRNGYKEVSRNINVTDEKTQHLQFTLEKD